MRGLTTVAIVTLVAAGCGASRAEYEICRPAGDRRLRSTPRAVAGSPPARTPTARCDCRTRRVPAAQDCGDAASSRVLGGRSSTGPTHCRRQGARWRRHSRNPSRDHRIDRRGRRHDARRSPFALRSCGTLARHPPGMTARMGRYAPPSSPPCRRGRCRSPLYAPDPALGATVAYTHGAPEDQRPALRGAIRRTTMRPRQTGSRPALSRAYISTSSTRIRVARPRRRGIASSAASRGSAGGRARP